MTEGTELNEVLGRQLRAFRKYPEYQDSGVEWLGQVPKHWEVRRLKTTIVSCQNGAWGDEANGEHDTLCVRVADFDRIGLRVRFQHPTYRSLPAELLRARSLSRSDLLLEKSGGGELQPVGVVVEYDHDAAAICSNFIARMRVANGYDNRYLAYVHAAAYAARVNLKSIKQNTGIQNLDSDAYLGEKAAFPPLEDQRRTATFLDRETAKLDALVGKKERLVKLLMEKLTALIARAVTRGLNPDSPMKDSEVEWLDKIPAHWEVAAFQRLLTRVEQGWSPTADDRIADENDWAVTKLSAVRGGAFDDQEHKALPLELGPRPDLEVQTGDVLLTRANTPELVGEACVVTQTRPRLILCDLIYRLRLRGQIAPSYLVYLLRSRFGRARIESDAVGASRSMLKISVGRLKSWPILLPPLDEQASIASFLDTESARFMSVVAKITVAMDRLRELRSALITAAVTGKIDVREETP
jgi:type I restriction enzyme, S subunit